MPYRVTPKVRARAAEAREAILQAALDQLAEGGYASTGMNAVAQRAGVATGTVYRHFPSKADLFAEVFRRAAQREVDVLEGVAGDRRRLATERVAACVEAFCRRALAEPTRAWALLAEPVDPSIEAERLAFRRVYRDGFARILRDGMLNGDLPAQDPDLVAAALVGALGEAMVGPLSDETPANNPEALIAGLVSFAVAAITAKQRSIRVASHATRDA